MNDIKLIQRGMVYSQRGDGLVISLELELELIISQMAQKPMLRGEVGARALRVRSDVRGLSLASQ